MLSQCRVVVKQYNCRVLSSVAFQNVSLLQFRIYSKKHAFFVEGYGYVTMEEMLHSPEGEILTNNLRYIGTIETCLKIKSPGY